MPLLQGLVDPSGVPRPPWISHSHLQNTAESDDAEVEVSFPLPSSNPHTLPHRLQIRLLQRDMLQVSTGIQRSLQPLPGFV